MSQSGIDRTLKGWIESRRVELGMTLDEVATAAGLTTEGIRLITNGTRTPRPLTQGKLERGLQWRPGSIAAILAGDAPLPLEFDDALRERRGTDADNEALVREQFRRLRRQLPREEFVRVVNEELARLRVEHTERERAERDATKRRRTDSAG